jgi:uncharacterized protein
MSLTSDAIFQSVSQFDDKPLPPVEKWDPDYCGELDLIIKADGEWLYNGTPINRYKMKWLFSRIIKKENHDYFLVTPVEKVGIKVEWQAFTLIDFDIVSKDGTSMFEFSDNFNNKIMLTELNQLTMSEFQNQRMPVVNIRRNLYASFSRNCYYRLIEEAEVKTINNQSHAIIESNNIEFSLGIID